MLAQMSHLSQVPIIILPFIFIFPEWSVGIAQ